MYNSQLANISRRFYVSQHTCAGSCFVIVINSVSGGVLLSQSIIIDYVTGIGNGARAQYHFASAAPLRCAPSA